MTEVPKMTDVLSAKLEPCPFCGEAPEMRGPVIGCKNTKCWGPSIWHMANAEDSAAAWNTRALSLPITAEPGEVKVGDTVRVLRALNAYGEDVYAFRKKPFAVGETFVVGRVDDEDNCYPCPLIYPVGEDFDFWRAPDVELVSRPTLTGKE